METKVSTKGQVVIPGALRRRLGLREGDSLGVNIEDGNIVLRPRHVRTHKAKIIIDPMTGLPVLSTGANAPVLSSREVEEILASFP